MTRTSTIPPRPTEGEFIAARHGPKWVYAQRATDRLRSRYPDSTVITPKQQRAIKDDYKRLYGEPYDDSQWAALYALRAIRDRLRDGQTTCEDMIALATAAIERLEK